MFDLVGDIHGFDEHFIELLKKMNYQQNDGVWQHPKRTLIVLGDILDRGPGQRKVIDILKLMQQHKKAIVLMGNHEFYAIAWQLFDSEGKPIRAHNAKNFAEHSAFLEQAQFGSSWYTETINWLKTLPLFIENEHFRCVHAAWDERHIARLKEYTNHNAVLQQRVWDAPSSIDIQFYKSLNYCLNGPKLVLPEGAYFIDSAGTKREKIRLKWWDVGENPTYRNACTSVPHPEQLPNDPIALASLPQIRGNKPIFFGHYWMQGQPKLMNGSIACLDWSVVQEHGVLAAYRYDGEKTLDSNKLVWV